LSKYIDLAISQTSPLSKSNDDKGKGKKKVASATDCSGPSIKLARLKTVREQWNTTIELLLVSLSELAAVEESEGWVKLAEGFIQVGLTVLRLESN
jgi:hypothetical protein